MTAEASKGSLTSLGATYPKVVSVINLKGGVGKTTLCVNLAYGLTYFREKRVLLVDLDPQANATQYLISEHSYRKIYLGKPPSKATVFELLKEFKDDDFTSQASKISDPERYIQRIYSGRSGYLDLLASKLELAMISFQEGYAPQNDQIRKLLEQIGSDYDIVLVDCPPTVSRMLIAAFEASQSFLIPVKPEFLSTIGIPLLATVLERIYYEKLQRRPNYLPKKLNPLGIVYTMMSEQLTMTKESIADLKRVADDLRFPIFKSFLSASTKFTWSSRRSLPIFRSEPTSRYAREVEALVGEFLQTLGEVNP